MGEVWQIQLLSHKAALSEAPGGGGGGAGKDAQGKVQSQHFFKNGAKCN